ncbi:MAG TPA: MFS transporter [Burkholderiales bacterium]|nr:MFS transporter [Burkholderiales bacterium]
MKSERYGWVVVAAAFALMFVGFGAAYAFAAFFTAFQSEFGASRAHVALVFSVAAFIWFVSGAPGGMLADRFGPRRVTLAGVACLAGALWLAGRASSVEMLYVTYSVGIGLGVGLVYVPSVGAVQPWFVANRAFASGIAVAGIGAGNFAVPLIAAWWIELFGWRGAYAALALFVLVLGGAAAAAIKALPRPKAAPAEGLPLRAALASRQFHFLYASVVLSCIGLFIPMVHLSPFARDAGYSDAQGVALVSFIGLGSLVGRFAVGAPADRLGRPLSLALAYTGLGVMLLVWWSSREYWILATFALAFGTFYGASVALLPTIIMDLYGARAVSGIIGCLYTGGGLGTLIGPWLAGAAYDAFGSYDVPILAGAAFSFLAAASVLPLLVRGPAQAAHRG